MTGSSYRAGTAAARSGGAGAEPWDRAAARVRLEREAWDVVVVGGGVTGAGVARDAALRGLSVALVEAGDWAAGASSRTTKFAHGGLRYLEHLDFGLVRESLAERAVLLAIAPHLVRATPFLLPVYAGRTRPAWKLRAGLTLYDALAGGTRLGRHEMLDRREALAREPALAGQGLRSAALYWDARVRDARLVVETVADARRAGAVAVSRCAVESVEQWGDWWAGEVDDRKDGSRFTLRGAAWVNATGPWADRLRAKVAPELPPLLAPTKGVHVVLAGERLPLRDPTVLFAADGRLLFAVPEGSWTFVGTTDTADGGAVDDVGVAPADVAYLVEAASTALAHPFAQGDIVGSWAGWRPLIRPATAKEPGEISREDVIEETAPGFFTVAGGKLTTYRRMAEEAVERLAEGEGRSLPRSGTARRPLVPPRPAGPGPPPGTAPADVARVRELFGPDAGHVFARWREAPETAEPLGAELQHTAAEVERAALEMVGSLADLVDRRLSALPGGVPVSEATLTRVAAAAAPVLGWDSTRQAAEVARFRQDTSSP